MREPRSYDEVHELFKEIGDYQHAMLNPESYAPAELDDAKRRYHFITCDPDRLAHIIYDYLTVLKANDPDHP